MNRKNTLFMALLAAVMVFTLFSSQAQAGWVEVNKETGTTYISDGMVKQVPNGENEPWSIFDVKKGSITVVEPANKSYMEIDTEVMCNEMEKLIEAMLAEVPPEQRAMMEQMMGGGGGEPRVPVVKVKKIGSGGVIAGLDTVKYSVTVDGRAYKDIWLALNAPIMKDTKDFFKGVMKMSRDIEGCSKAAGAMVDLTPETTEEYIKLVERGWTMKEVIAEGGAVASEVTSLKKKSIPTSEFKVPPAYTKIDMMEQMMGRMGR